MISTFESDFSELSDLHGHCFPKRGVFFPSERESFSSSIFQKATKSLSMAMVNKISEWILSIMSKYRKCLIAGNF